MFGIIADRVSALNLSAAVPLPLWQLILAAALFGFVCTWIAGQASLDSKGLKAARFLFVFLLATVGAWAIDHFAARDIANERRAINAQAFDLRLRSLLPGSSLGCLDAAAGETVDDACEKALFTSAETTASAVSYVAAQIALLSFGKEHAQAAGINYSKILTNVRRAVEADRFGIVAHVLSMTSGCAPDACEALALLEDKARVKANLAERPFEALVKERMAAWAAAGAPIASNPSPTGSVPPVGQASRPPSKAYFPSSSSIPSVNIMTAEPATTTSSREATASADAAPSGRKPPSSTPARQGGPANAGAPTSGPLQIVPQSQ